MSTPEPQLSRSLQWWPWPPGDPAPEIWRIILELDKRVQVQVVDAVLDTHIQIARAHVKGLETIRKIVGGAGG
jgi:hypothetical protein